MHLSCQGFMHIFVFTEREGGKGTRGGRQPLSLCRPNLRRSQLNLGSCGTSIASHKYVLNVVNEHEQDPP